MSVFTPRFIVSLGNREPMARKRLLTVEDAVLLHLLDYTRFTPEDSVPMELTQAGMSATLGVRRSHISMSLDAAVTQGNAEEHLSRVKGEKRKRKCYFLTHAGKEAARGLKASVAATRVRAELPDGSPFKGTLDGLAEKLGIRLPALALLVKEGRVSIPGAVRGFPRHAAKLPQVAGFRGREEELMRVSELLEGKVRNLAVIGMPGIGKTALVARAVQDCPADRILWYSVTDWTSPRNAITHIADILSAGGSNRLKRYLEFHEIPDMGDVRDILAAESLQLTMIFDDCHKAGQSMQAFLGMLAHACDKSSRLGLCLVGRHIQFLDGFRAHGEQSGTSVIVLGPLDMESSLEMLRDRGIKENEAKAIAEKSGGHPFYLSLAKSRSDPGDITEMLAREVHASLSETEAGLMHQISVFREPISAEEIAETQDEIDALDNLSRLFLLIRAGEWSMHSLLRDFYYSRQPQPMREARHERAAEYYAMRGQGGSVERLYHLFMARDYDSAVMGLVSSGGKLVTQGYVDEILALCALVPEGWQNPDDRFGIGFLHASALDMLGRWDEASDLYRQSLAIARELGDLAGEAKVLGRLGAVQYRKGDLKGARGTLEKALAMSTECPETLRAELSGSLGVILWKLGETDDARKSHESDLRISREQGDGRGIARALNNLGILDWQSSDYTKALEKYAQALACAEKLVDSRLVAILYSNMGDVHRSTGNPAEARRYYERCLELAEDLKFDWQIAEAYRGLAEVVPEKRQDYLSRALNIFERLGAAEDAKTVRETRR